MMGAFFAYLLLNQLGISYWWSLMIVPIVVGCFRAVIERLMLSKLYKLRATIPADQAFRPIGEGKCPLVSG